MTPRVVCRVRWLQKLRQCVAGASATLGDDVEMSVSSFCAAFVEWRLVRRSLDEGREECRIVEWEGGGVGGESWWRMVGDEAAPCGDVLVRARWSSDGALAVTVVVIIPAMWNGSRALVSTRTRGRDETDPWCSFVVEWRENWYSRGACGFLVPTGISPTKVTSNADHKRTMDPILEPYVTDLYYLGNDVTGSHSSSSIKPSSSGRERQRTAKLKEALVDALSLQQELRRSFFLMLIIESRVGQGRPCDPKIYSAAFKEQVHDAQSLRLVEEYSATFCQPALLQDQQPYLYPGLNDAACLSLMVLSLMLEIDMDVVALLCTPVDLLFFLEFGERDVVILIVDRPRKLLLQVGAFLVKVPQFEVGMPCAPPFSSLSTRSPQLGQLLKMEYSPKNL